MDEGHRAMVCSEIHDLQPFLDAVEPPPAFEIAGPRLQISFAPETVTCGIVTFGIYCCARQLGQ